MSAINRAKQIKYIGPWLLISLLFTLSINLCLGYAENKSEPEYRYLKKRAEFYKNQLKSFKKALKENSISVPSSFHDKMVLFLQNQANDLIKRETSQETLKWNIHSLVFLREDLIYAHFDDGEMYGGEILIKINYVEEKTSINAIALWTSATE